MGFHATDGRSKVRTSLLTLAILTGAVAATAVAAPQARAQTTDVQPRQVVVTTDSAPIRCGGGDVWYAVGQAKRGDVLTADGEAHGWIRVQYPAGVRALVAPEDGEFVQGRNKVRLTRPSGLLALYMNADVRDSWKRLLTDKMPAGTELDHIETVNDAQGRIAGFIVRAPEAARGFVSAQAVRPATPQDIAAAAPSQPVVPPPTSPTTTTAAPRGDFPSGAADGGQTAAAPGAGQPQTTPMTTTATRPAPGAAPAPDVFGPMPYDGTAGGLAWGSGSSFEHDSIAPAPERPARTASAPAPERRRDPASFEDLDKVFKRLAQEPTEDAELEPLLAEFEALRTSLPDVSESEPVRRAIQSRVELLKIRIDLQKDMQRIAAVEQNASKGIEEIKSRVFALSEMRQYVAVGRLTSSTIYNGQDLPLMYRLQSVDTASAHTIAYLAPSEVVDLKGKLGSIVGVEGEGRIDPALRVNIIHPKRIDVLTTASAAVVGEE